MDAFLQRMKQHKLVQWAIAYVAFAFALIQVLDAVAGSYHWPDVVMHIAFGVLALGFVVLLLLAWYHGERGAQRISGPELLLIALVLAVGGGLLWHYANAPAPTVSGSVTASVHGARPTGAGTGGASAHKSPASAAIAGQPSAPAAAPLPARPIPAQSVAVLPFENLSTDKANAYFADGMQDLILTKLADIGDLKVISRTSTLQYGSHPENLTLVGKQLGVAAILEGSVQKAGKQVLINVQLIDAKTDRHIWAPSYTRTLDNIFDVEGEVAAKVAKALNAKLTRTEQHEIARLPTTNAQAYTLYLKGVHQIHQFFTGDGKPDHVKRAVSVLQQAVAKDPDFALAYALLARAQGDLQFNDIENNPALARSELANARKAVALQPNLAEAHDYLAVAYGANRMPDKVIPELETALRLDPTDEQTRFHLASELMDRGHWDRAKVIMAPVIRMNPTNALAYTQVARMDIALRQYAQAQRRLEQGMAIAPQDAQLEDVQASLFLALGEPHKALQWSAKLSTVDGTRQSVTYAAYMQLHQFAQALSAAQSMPDGGSGFGAASKELMIADAAQHAGDASLARDALAKVRSAIAPYLRNPSVGPSMVQSDRTRTYEMLAGLEALAGHRKAAMNASRKALSLFASSPYAASARTGFRALTAGIATHFGDAKAAVENLQSILLTPGTGRHESVGTLRRGPTWDPIRQDPRFQTLLKQYAKVEADAALTGNTTKTTGTGGE